MRGRLIQKFTAVLYRLDPVGTAAVVGGGYDQEFGEPRRVNNGSQLGLSSRRELAALRLPCQIDRQPDFDSDALTRGGHMKSATIDIILHMADIENAGLLGVDGQPKLYSGDRVGGIEDKNGNVVWSFTNPPGMFVEKTEPQGYGLDAFGVPKFNLFVLTCKPEQQGGLEVGAE